jgi:hypothetical protein
VISLPSTAISTRSRTAVFPGRIAPFLAGILISLAIVCVLRAEANLHRPIPILTGRLVAVGIPGAGALSAVGTFHVGGPIHDKPAFHAFTESGAVLDPVRILVASSSNFGAPLARADLPEGAILSIDPNGTAPVQVPPTFAHLGGQASVQAGRVSLLTANSPAFLNSVYNPGAVTANFAPVANPTGISLNNAFGRIWITSMPSGPSGAGLHSILDPDGRPLNNAPDKAAGGVFTGTVTNRQPQLIPGSMATGALATVLLGKSPDGSGRAVFASLHADGSIVQLHVERGVDGLAPAGTITPFRLNSRATRAGMVFNWVPTPVLYVVDPQANTIIALSLRDDGTTFRVESIRHIEADILDIPVDLAPAISEIVSSTFSSNTTLAGNADFFVVNRGNGTIVRISQDGRVVAVRKLKLPGLPVFGADRLNGIAVSPDAQHLWITVTGNLPGYPEGAVVELPAFGAADNGL